MNSLSTKGAFRRPLIKSQMSLPESRFQNMLVEREEGAGDGDVGKGDAFTDQEGLMEEMFVENLQDKPWTNFS